MKKTSLLIELQKASEMRLTVRLHVQAKSRTLFNGFQLTENHGVFQEYCQWIPPKGKVKGYCLVTLEVRDFFFLKQRLLSCGLPFQIIMPTDFRDEVVKTLNAMLHRYQRPSLEKER